MLRIQAVLERLGCGRTQFYVDIANRLVTRQVHLTGRSVGWPHEEIEAICTARAGGATEEELRRLVAKLEDLRSEKWQRLQVDLGMLTRQPLTGGRATSPHRGRRA